MRTRLAGPLLCLLFLPAVAVAADPPAALLKKESAAVSKVASELQRLARFCVSNQAIAEARAVLRTGLEIAPGDARLTEDLGKLEGREDKPRSGFAAKYDKKRSAAHLKCAGWLADVAVAFDRKGFTDRFDIYLHLTRTHFPSPKAMAKFGLVWFEPYRQWYRKEDAGRLAEGGERIDGEWREPGEVAKLDAAHSTWADPWVLTDVVHELRTNIPIREARRILRHVSAFREFFLEQFAGEWDLKAPKGKLPILLTRTQREFRAQMKLFGRAGQLAGRSGAAYYYWTNQPHNPCFVTFEPVDAAGQMTTVDHEDVLLALRHEVAHQIAFEYSKHDCNNAMLPTHHYWAVEAIANFVQNYVLDEKGWTLARRRTWKFGAGVLEGDFAYCKRALSDLPSLREFFATTPGTFGSVENYHLSGTVAYFLLEGADRRHRSSFLSLLEKVHKIRAEAGSFEECFEGVDMPALQRQWEAFVRGIELDRE